MAAATSAVRELHITLDSHKFARRLVLLGQMSFLECNVADMCSAGVVGIGEG